MKGKVLGAKCIWGFTDNLFALWTNPKCSQRSHTCICPLWQDSIWKDLGIKGAGFGDPQDIIQYVTYHNLHRCQRQLQISHMQPEVFMQEPRNFGFDQKPQIGVNISLATFYDIYILHVSSWSDESNMRCRHMLWIHLQVRWRNHLKRAGRMT